ncbi:Zn-dependent exopeptidase [Trametes versicolor FP-101664 SS1]|uniref:Zn-dependent exopeptidase n=1 Tax=Trametes versicolor (strain FP-101664) TaxID=717944 RepID=UPI0004622649|nr:Zn-dependent exopeptidase [Trametes versicolor FP-101664 SS1]EIW65394.1 Zn-dependent exopeptidase [Trametes versicolor FP-101664 SS1]
MSSISVLPVDPSAPFTSVDSTRICMTPSAFEATLCSLGKMHLLYSAQKETIITLTSLRIKFAHKTGSARREAVRKANRSSFKQIHNLQECARQQSIGTRVWVRYFLLAFLDLVSAIAEKCTAYSFTLKTKPTYPFDPRLTPPAYEKPQYSPLSQKNFCGTRVSILMSLIRSFLTVALRSASLEPASTAATILAPYSLVPTIGSVLYPYTVAIISNKTTFLAVTEGAPEPAKFSGIYVQGAADAAPPVLVGKGITFDSEEISGAHTECYHIEQGMSRMHEDSGGAATVCASALAIAINLFMLTPGTENMSHPVADHPGDMSTTYIVYVMNHEPIQIDNTDGEGRLVLYGKPILAGSMDYDVITTMTSRAALLQVLDWLQDELHAADLREHYRFWRMRLDEEYDPQLYGHNVDLDNVHRRTAHVRGCCTAALFLTSFFEGVQPVHDTDEPAMW